MDRLTIADAGWRIVAAAPASASSAPDATLNAGAISTFDAGKDRTGFNPSHPLFRKLVAGVQYSHHFALTYFGVIAVLVLIFTSINWVPRLKRWGRKRRHSASRIVDEQTPLLKCGDTNQDPSLQSGKRADTGAAAPGSRETSWNASSSTGDWEKYSQVPAGRHAFRTFQSWLIYQPSPLPLFRNRTMPSNGASLLIMTCLGLNIFYLVYNIEFTVPMLFVLADRAGLLFATNLPVLYVLSAKNQPLQPLIGYSYASLNIVHRRLGEWMCLLAIIHGVGMFVVWATLLEPTGYTFSRFITDKVTITGIFAFTCYQLIYATSIATIRQRAYELFLAAHIILQVGALVLLFFHHHATKPYIGVALGVWLVDRVVCRLCAKTRTFKAALTVMPDAQTIGLTVSVPQKETPVLRRLLGLKTIESGWKTLDHIFLSVPAMAHKHIFQAHPFSIASVPRSSYETSTDLNLIIRAQDGFSKDLLSYAADHDTVRVRLDGPYGAHHALRMLQGKDARAIIAGGSGIAVTWPLAQALLADEAVRDNDLEHATDMLPVRPVLFVWIVHTREQYSWIDQGLLDALAKRAGVEVVLPSPTAEGGRPNVVAIVEQWVQGRHKGDDVGVVCSGPDSMARDLRNGCANMLKRGTRVEVEIEKYGW